MILDLQAASAVEKKKTMKVWHLDLKWAAKVEQSRRLQCFCRLVSGTNMCFCQGFGPVRGHRVATKGQVELTDWRKSSVRT